MIRHHAGQLDGHDPGSLADTHSRGRQRLPIQIWPTTDTKTSTLIIVSTNNFIFFGIESTTCGHNSQGKKKWLTHEK